MTLNPLRAAYAHNSEALQRETEETHAILLSSIQSQQSSSEALRDENGLLRVQLEEARRETHRMTADLQAERVASAAMTRQITSQQQVTAQLRLEIQAERAENAKMRQLLINIVSITQRQTYLRNLFQRHSPNCALEVLEYRTTLGQMDKAIAESDTFLNEPGQKKK